MSLDRPGRALGLDLGSKRIGVAVSDDMRMLATPLAVIRRVGDRVVEHGEINDHIAETGATVLVVGMPYTLDGDEGATVRAFRSELKGLRKRITIPIETVDERFTTVTAEAELRAAGVSAKKQRGIVDAVAASVLLQHWLDGGSG